MLTESNRDHLAYIYTRKPKKNERVGSTHHVSVNGKETSIFIDHIGDDVQGVELLDVYEIWVNGRMIWRAK